MEQLRRLKGDVEAYLSRLSPRERVMVTGGAFAVAAFIIFFVSMSVSKSITAREGRIEEKTQVLAEVAKLAQGYRAAETERNALEAKLKGPPTQLMTYVSQVGTRLGIGVDDIHANTAVTTDRITEDSVEVALPKLELRKLAQLLEELERGPGVIKVRNLRVTTRNDDQSLVDVSIRVATFQLKS